MWSTDGANDIVVVFASDLRQILVVTPKGTRQDALISAINYYNLRGPCKGLNLLAI